MRVSFCPRCGVENELEDGYLVVVCRCGKVYDLVNVEQLMKRGLQNQRQFQEKEK